MNSDEYREAVRQRLEERWRHLGEQFWSSRRNRPEIPPWEYDKRLEALLRPWKETALPDLDDGTSELRVVEFRVIPLFEAVLEGSLGAMVETGLERLGHIAREERALPLHDRLEDVTDKVILARVESKDPRTIDHEFISVEHWSCPYSWLKVCWFEADLSAPIPELVHRAIRGVDWNRYANVGSAD